jgi:Ala-tRNA(Pro) deacylase
MPTERLKKYLDEEEIPYLMVRHSRAFTAQEVAASCHIPGHEMAKTVIIKLDGEMVMAVLPASAQIDLDLLRDFAGAESRVRLADEMEFQDLFPGCELGAMPPFGNLYGMEVFVAPELAANEEIAFNAGSHTEIIRMSYSDFERLVRPRVMRFATEAV